MIIWSGVRRLVPSFLPSSSLTGFALAGVCLAGIARAQCLEYATEFGPLGGGLSRAVHAQLVFDDGTGPALYVGGHFQSTGDVPATGVAKWDGTSWSALGMGLDSSTGFYGTVNALAVHDDGSGPALYAGGIFNRSGETNVSNVAKWNGTQWTSVGGGPGISQVRALATFDDGSGPALYAGGYASHSVRRWNGSTWSSVDPGPPLGPEVYSLLVHDDGSGSKLYVGVVGDGVLRLEGSNWVTVGGSLNGGRPVCMTIFDDGTGPALYAGGIFAAGGVTTNGIAKWNGVSWSALGTGVDRTELWEAPEVHALAAFDDGSGPRLYVGGRFDVAGGLPVNDFAAWDGSSWSAVPGGGTFPYHYPGVRSLMVFDDGNGPMLHVGCDVLVAGTVVSAGLARWDGTWHPMLDGTYEGLFGEGPRSIAAFDDGTGEALYSSGGYLTGVARWNGTSWSAVGKGAGSGTSLKVFDDGTGPALYLGKAFGVSGARVLKWNGQTWSQVGSLEDEVDALAVYDSGTGPKLYAGGKFSGGIKVWDGTSWVLLSAGPLDHNVSCMTVHDDGAGPALYVAGRFTQANGSIPTQRIAKWKGGSWLPLGCGLGIGNSTTSNENVVALESFDFGSGRELVAAGWFGHAGCAPSNSVVRWNGSSWSSLPQLGNNLPNEGVKCLLEFDDGAGLGLYAGGDFEGGLVKWTGSSWTPLGGGLDLFANVYSLASFERVSGTGPDLFASGLIQWAGGIPSQGIAEWRGCAGPGREFCFGDGSDGACPCSNNGAPGHGCENSSSTGGATLTATGRRHPDTVVLSAAGERPTAFSIFLQGRASIGPLNYGDGLRCAGGALKRLYNKNAVGGQVSAPQPGDLSITARSAQAGDPIALGSTRYYQTYYRDPSLSYCPSPTGNTLNVTNGVRIEW